MFLGNTLYAVAFIYYTYITFLGYNCTSEKIDGTYGSTTILDRDAVIADPDPSHIDIISYQSVRIPYIQDGGGDVFREVMHMASKQACSIYQIRQHKYD